MKTHNKLVWSQRKSLGLTFFLALGLPGLAFAQEMPMNSPANAAANGDTAQSDKAMADYCQTAQQQLDAYRQKIMGDPSPVHEDATGIAKDKLVQCSKLLTKLKEANADQFNNERAQFEAARADLDRAVQAAIAP